MYPLKDNVRKPLQNQQCPNLGIHSLVELRHQVVQVFVLISEDLVVLRSGGKIRVHRGVGQFVVISEGVHFLTKV